MDSNSSNSPAAPTAPEHAEPAEPVKAEETAVVVNAPADNQSTPVDKKPEEGESPVKTESDTKKEEANGNSSADFMAHDSIGKAMWKLTYPSLIAKVVSAMYAVCDSMFIGQLAGETQDERTLALAAVSFAMPLEQGIIHSLAMMVSNGGSTVFGQSLGEKNVQKSKRTVGNTYFMEIVVALILACVFTWLVKPLLKLVGATEAQGVLDMGAEYITTLFLGSITYCFYISSTDLLRGQGSAILSCCASITAGLLNILGDPLYIKLFGVCGAAVSTVIANLVSSIVGLRLMKSKKAAVRLECADLKPNWALDKHIMITGMSGLVSGFAGAFVSIISNRLVLRYSPYPPDDLHTSAIIGAWGAMSKVYFISFLPLIALAQGVLPLLAYSFGAKLHKRFMDCAKLMFIWEIGITVVLEAVILIFAPQIATIFSNEPLFIEFFVPAIRIMVAPVFLQPIVMSLFPMLQAVGKGGAAGMLLGMKTCIIILITQVLISMIMQNYWGAVYAYPVTEVLSALLALFLYQKNKKSFYGSQELPIVASKWCCLFFTPLLFIEDCNCWAHTSW